MLIYWLQLALLKLRWLVKYPTKLQIARMNPNMACPVCGARQGSIRCVQRQDASTKSIVLGQHTCAVCGARWYEKPVVAVQPTLVYPAVPRTDLEKLEDRAWSTGAVGVQ